MLYGIVREHLATFLEHAERTYATPLPRYVALAFEGYLACGDLARGFVRCHCDACRHDVLVALSCKPRGPCPSCAARRMCNEAATLVDRVLPNAPLRQGGMPTAIQVEFDRPLDDPSFRFVTIDAASDLRPVVIPPIGETTVVAANAPPD